MLLLELIVRIWAGAGRPPIMILDPELGWVHRPSVQRSYVTEGVIAHIRTNRQGLRGPELAPRLPGAPARPRLLILGDSFTDGLEVDDAALFSTLLAARRPDLEILNAGVGGYGTVQEMLLMRRLRPRLRPDRYVLMICKNDLTDNLMPFSPGIGPGPYVDDGGLRPPDWGPFLEVQLPLPFAGWLHRHSLLMSALHSRYIQSSLAARKRARIQHLMDRLPEQTRWRVLRQLVTEMLRGERAMLVAIPLRQDLESNDRRFGRGIQALGEQLGLPVLDLQQALGPAHYYTHDIHWNAAGHLLVATQLARVL